MAQQTYGTGYRSSFPHNEMTPERKLKTTRSLIKKGYLVPGGTSASTREFLRQLMDVEPKTPECVNDDCTLICRHLSHSTDGRLKCTKGHPTCGCEEFEEWTPEDDNAN